MALKAVINQEEFDELDEGVQALYAEKDDAHILQIDGINDHPTVVSLKNGHENSKKERNEAKKKLQAIEKRFGPILKADEDVHFDDLDEDALANVIKFAKGEVVLVEPDPDDPDGKGKKPDPVDLEKVRDLARKPLVKELEERTGERDGFKSQLDTTIKSQDLTEALIASKIMPVYMAPLRAMFSNQIKLIDGDGDDRPSSVIEGDVGEQSVKAYIADWAQTDDGKAFVDAGGNTGGGNNGGNRGGPTDPKEKNPWDKKADDGKNWNVTKQMAIYKADPTKAIRMAKEHGVTLE